MLFQHPAATNKNHVSWLRSFDGSWGILTETVLLNLNSIDCVAFWWQSGYFQFIASHLSLQPYYLPLPINNQDEEKKQFLPAQYAARYAWLRLAHRTAYFAGVLSGNIVYYTLKLSIQSILYILYIVYTSNGGCRRAEKSRKHWSFFTMLLSSVTDFFFIC